MAYKEGAELPGFGEEVLVRKKIWHGAKANSLEPRHEKVSYICPRPEQHGHMVMRDRASHRGTLLHCEDLDAAREKGDMVGDRGTPGGTRGPTVEVRRVIGEDGS